MREEMRDVQAHSVGFQLGEVGGDSDVPRSAVAGDDGGAALCDVREISPEPLAEDPAVTVVVEIDEAGADNALRRVDRLLGLSL